MISEEQEEIISQAVTLIVSLLENPNDESLQKTCVEFCREHGAP
jgi:hypothetical protein